MLKGLNEGRRDLTWQKWSYQVRSHHSFINKLQFSYVDGILQIGLRGETLNLHSLSGSSSVEWQEASRNQPLTWYKVKL